MKIFIIGITGRVGSLLARSLQDRGDTVSGLVRRPDQQSALQDAGIGAAVGDLTALTPEELAGLTGDVDAIVFTAGAGGGTAEQTTAIDFGGVVTAIAAADLRGITRFGLVSAFPEAWRDRDLGAGFEHYMDMKKHADQALTHSDLDWIILRPAVLLDEAGTGRIALGPAELHGDVPRQDVADTMAELLHEPRITRRILELNHGDTPVAEAVQAAVRR